MPMLLQLKWVSTVFHHSCAADLQRERSVPVTHLPCSHLFIRAVLDTLGTHRIHFEVDGNVVSVNFPLRSVECQDEARMRVEVEG